MLLGLRSPAGQPGPAPLRLRFGAPPGLAGLPSRPLGRRPGRRRRSTAKERLGLGLPAARRARRASTSASLAEQSLATGALLAALAALALGLAAVYLRRTRPDLRPRRGPARTIRCAASSATWGRLRERYTPDPGAGSRRPARPGRSASCVAAALFGRARRPGRPLRGRWRTARTSRDEPRPPPTPRDVVPGLWRVEGRSARAPRSRSGWPARCATSGPEPAGHLAFAAQPGAAAEVTADAGRVAPSRELGPAGRWSWSRRSRRADAASCASASPGEPARTVFPVRQAGEPQLRRQLTEHHRDARSAATGSTSRARYREPPVSGYRVSLQGGDLLPVPALRRLDRQDGAAPEDGLPPGAEVELSLAVPPACSWPTPAAASPASGPGASRAAAALPLADLAVVGRPAPAAAREERPARTAWRSRSSPPIAQAGGAPPRASSRAAPRMLEEAWPGLGALGRLVVLEWPARGDPRARRAVSWRLATAIRTRASSTVQGQAGLPPGDDLIRLRPSAGALVAEVVASRLAQPAPARARAAALLPPALPRPGAAAAGPGTESGAVVGPLAPDGQTAGPQVPPLAENAYHGLLALPLPRPGRRPGAAASGAEPLRAAVEELLARGEDPAGDVRRMRRRSCAATAREPVDGMIRDFFLAGDLPEPVLEGVEFRRAGDGWRATGRMRNQGDGEALCRVVLAADAGAGRDRVRAGTGESAALRAGDAATGRRGCSSIPTTSATAWCARARRATGSTSRGSAVRARCAASAPPWSSCSAAAWCCSR